MLLLDKVKNLELELFVAKEQTNRFASFKLDHMLSVQKFPLNKTGLGFVESISVFETHFTKFVSSSEPPKSEIVKPVEVIPIPKPKNPTFPKDKVHDRPFWVYHFCGKTRHIHPNCFKLQATKRANKLKVLMPQALDPMVLIGELIETLNLYSNPGVARHSNMNNNSNARVASNLIETF